MTTGGVEVRRADVTDLDQLVPLFDAYRRFYRQSSDLEKARPFLWERFEKSQSVIFLAIQDGVAIGFTQLYPSFSSGALYSRHQLNTEKPPVRSAWFFPPKSPTPRLNLFTRRTAGFAIPSFVCTSCRCELRPTLPPQAACSGLQRSSNRLTRAPERRMSTSSVCRRRMLPPVRSGRPPLPRLVSRTEST
jgi:hypothetical protein